MGEPAISPAECRAMRILYGDGWEKPVLRMCFDVSNTRAVGYHVHGNCAHDVSEGPHEAREFHAGAKAGER